MSKITIRFDGGCKPTNPGNKYGSFEVSLDGRQIALMSRIEFGYGTNNEAEFDAFEAGLKWTVESLKEAGNSPSQFVLEAFSDSTIVVNRINQKNAKINSEPQKRMAEFSNRCLKYCILFRSFKSHWNGRDSNVFKFGH